MRGKVSNGSISDHEKHTKLFIDYFYGKEIKKGGETHMNNKFEEGDRVLVILEDDELFNTAGIVMEVDEDEVEILSEETEERHWFEKEDLKSLEKVRSARVTRSREFVKSEESMSTLDKLSNLTKKLLSPATKNMIKAGWLDESLNLTAEGTDVVISEYFAENEEKFGKLAAELLKEKKEEAKK